ncbi:hypothetical protein BDV19DRAFT_256271 [Aspergillus venezuelensis]
MATSTPTPAPTSRRVTRPRSRNGCITCKIRHVKCTEEKPSCGTCTRSGRKCDGYDSSSQTQLKARIAERQRPLERDTFGADHRLVLRQETRTERRYVDFFYTRTSHAFSGFYVSKLWSYLIPQFGEHEPSVRHALTAIGAIHSRVQVTRGWEGNGQVDVSAPTERFVLEEYNKSISTLIKTLSARRGESIDLTLTTCALFVCLEMLRNNQKEALNHIEAGLRIIHKHEQGTTASTYQSELYNQLRDLFLRLNLQASFFGRLIIPLKLTSPQSTNTLSPGTPFNDISEARSTLDQQMTKALLFIRSVGIMREARNTETQHALVFEQETLRLELLSWRASHDKLLSRLGPKISPCDLCASYLLRIYYHTARLWVLNVLERTEDGYDRYTSDFEAVVSYAEEVLRLNTLQAQQDPTSALFTLEGEIIAPLYYASCRCRHPVIRRRALNILFAYSKREGMWDAQLYARVAKLVIDVEESSCSIPPEKESDIGTLARVYEEVQPKERLENPTNVVLYMKPKGVEGPWKMVSVKVDW